MSIQTKGEFGGLGITVGMRDGCINCYFSIDDTHLLLKLVLKSEYYLKINDKSTINMTLDEAISLMRGEPKTDISLTVVRKGKLNL